MYASEGESANISVPVRSHPEPSSVAWQKVADIPEDIQKSSAFSLGHDMWLYYMPVDSVAAEDFATYVCEIANSVGENLVVQISLKRKGKCNVRYFSGQVNG